MNTIENLDIEIINKAKEAYKLVLKKKKVNVIFNPPNESEKILESTSVSIDKHIFHLYKTYEYVDLMTINNKYYKFFTKKMRIKLKKLSMEKRKKLIRRKIWYTIFLIPFYGKRIKINKDKIFKYLLNYNGILIDLTKLEYDKFFYYAKYVYKLKQLYNLNNELNINQEFTIIFDDDKSIFNLYNNFFNIFNEIISNSLIENDISIDLNDLIDMDDDDDDDLN